jgi:DnaJ-class molecular chaperone
MTHQERCKVVSAGLGSEQARGGTPGRPDSMEEITCPKCEGAGNIPTGNDFLGLSIWRDCSDCSGTGTKVIEP